MSLKVVLKEQIERNNNNIKIYEKRIMNLPKGTLQKRNIKGRPYYYLKFRDENQKVISQYIKEEQVDQINQQLKKRKEYELIIFNLKEDVKIAKKGLR